MTRPWTIIDSIQTDEGTLELRQRGERDFLIMLGPLVLMNSTLSRSEVALGRQACAHLATHPAPRVLVGGLGMGLTLRAVLDTLPETGQVLVAELNPVVVGWCRGPLSAVTGGATQDPRVTVEVADVADVIRRHTSPTFDAIALDLYRGPHPRTDPRNDPVYGTLAIRRAKAALRPGGVLAAWGEVYDQGFDQRLLWAGFRVETVRPRRGRLQHALFVGTLP